MPVWPMVLVRAAVALALLAGVHPGRRPPEPPPEASCPLLADVRFPVLLTAEILNAPEPGGILRARVQVEVRGNAGPVRIRVAPPHGVSLLGPPDLSLPLLAPGVPETREISLRLPPGRARQTVLVTAEVELDEGILHRDIVLNIVFDPEPYRRVVGPDGRAVREVRAERIP